jgi:hypothetical protein
MLGNTCIMKLVFVISTLLLVVAGEQQLRTPSMNLLRKVLILLDVL